MTPFAVAYAPEAAEQLAALAAYISANSTESTAHRYVDALLTTCERLRHFPHRGVPRDDIRPGLRLTHHKGRAVIAYAVDDLTREVRILGVFYGGQDVKAALQPDMDD